MVELILKKDIIGLGEEGDMVKVKNGYARNFLLPHAYAVKKTAANLKVLERQKDAIAKRKEEKRVLNDGLKGKIEAVKIELQRRVHEGNKLYGSVSAKELVEILKEQSIDIAKQNIEMPGPLKLLGDHQVHIKLSNGDKAELKVSIKPLEL